MYNRRRYRSTKGYYYVQNPIHAMWILTSYCTKIVNNTVVTIIVIVAISSKRTWDFKDPLTKLTTCR